jgi:hypothetical protein
MAQAGVRNCERRPHQIPDLPAIACIRAVAAVRAGTLFARARLIHVQCSAIEFLAVERRHGGFGLGIVIHRDERETARLAGHAVHHQRDFADLSVLFEKILEIVFSGLKREITNV